MKWVVVIVTVIIVGALGVAYHLKTNFPKADPPYNIRVSGTPEQIARGTLFSQSRHGMSRMPFNAGLGALFCATDTGHRGQRRRGISRNSGISRHLDRTQYYTDSFGKLDRWRNHSGFYQRRK